MGKRNILYWVTTILLAAGMAFGGVVDVLQPGDFLEQIEHLGYPAYFFTMLGVWKVLGAVAVLAPGFPRLKEWAYAGFAFDLLGAIVSHLAVGDPLVDLISPAIGLVILVESWRRRPPGRRV